MNLEITHAVVTVHPFGMDTVHLYTKLIDPCDPGAELTVSFKCPRNMGINFCMDTFTQLRVEKHDFSKERTNV